MMNNDNQQNDKTKVNDKNKVVYVERNPSGKFSFLAPGKLKAVICYLLALFVLSSFLILLIASIYSNATGVDYGKIVETFANADLSQVEETFKRANAICQAYGNLICYVLATFLVVFFLRDKIKADFRDLKTNYKVLIPYCLLAAFVFVFFTLGVDAVVGSIVGDSTNQSSIVDIMKYGGAVPMIIVTICFAPIVEELIYRYVVFDFFKGRNIALSYAFSIILFTLPHMLTTPMTNPGIWLLQCVPYAVSGAGLGYIYQKSKFNIYSTIFVHLINNFVAVLITFLPR